MRIHKAQVLGAGRGAGRGAGGAERLYLQARGAEGAAADLERLPAAPPQGGEVGLPRPYRGCAERPGPGAVTLSSVIRLKKKWYS